jgi:formylglycine-generating enzyme required for sulfatase activity
MYMRSGHPCYEIRPGTLAGGTVTANFTAAFAGTTITLSAQADPGYVLNPGSFQYNSIPVTGYSFTMPAADIDISAGFEALPSVTFTTPAQYRATVSLSGGTITGSSAYYYDAGNTGVFIEGRTVTLSPFKIAEYATTYELWYEVKTWADGNGYTFANAGREGNGGTDGDPPTTAAKTEPVTYIDWRDAAVWCNAYSEMSGKEPVYYTDTGYGTVVKTSSTAADNAVMKPASNGYRLPTEAEWEYAARGGNSSAPSFADKWAGTNTEADLENYAWYDFNSGSATHPAGGKAANGAGIYDMSGNVYEWCWDWQGSISAATDPSGPASGTGRVGRGGSWLNDASYSAVACRYGIGPYIRAENMGFRVVCP